MKHIKSAIASGDNSIATINNHYNFTIHNGELAGNEFEQTMRMGKRNAVKISAIVILSKLLSAWGDLWCDQHKTRRCGRVYHRGDWLLSSKSGHLDRERHKLKVEPEEHMAESNDFEFSCVPVIVFNKNEAKLISSAELVSSAAIDATTRLDIGTEYRVGFRIPSIREEIAYLPIRSSFKHGLFYVEGTVTPRCGKNDIEKHIKKAEYTVSMRLSGSVVLFCNAKVSGHRRQFIPIQEVFGELSVAAKEGTKLARYLKHFEVHRDHVNFLLCGSIVTYSYHPVVDSCSDSINSKADQKEGTDLKSDFSKVCTAEAKNKSIAAVVYEDDSKTLVRDICNKGKPGKGTVSQTFTATASEKSSAIVIEGRSLDDSNTRNVLLDFASSAAN